MSKKSSSKNGLWANAWKRLKRNKRAMFGRFIFFLLVLIAIAAPLIAPEGYNNQVVTDQFIAPGSEHWFGTDKLGRDVFSRIVWGARYSISIGVVSVAISMILGGGIGAIAGFYGGTVDNLIMRVMDIIQAIPNILLAVAISAALGTGLFNTMLAIGLSGIPGFARLIRGSILSIRESEYVEAARAITASDGRIILKHIIPNVMSPMLVQATMNIGSSILAAASLSFIGLGVQAPMPEWGAMISDGRNYIRHQWWIATYPGLAIVLTVVSINLFGDGLRDALDPRLSR